jgi:D-alanyl-D-alanine carboxypeptidase (penicillin-binding protein 5/6)
VTVPRGTAGDLKSVVELQPRLVAPLAADAIVGRLRVTQGAEELATAPLHPLHAVAAGGWWRRLIDTIRLWFA